MRNVRRYFPVLLLAGALMSAGGASLAAQAGTSRQTDPVDDQRAAKVREEFMKVLQRYPPALAGVLKLDPTMITNDQYLAPYPAVGAFLAQHPEVRRSPGYYLEQVRTGSEYYGPYYDPRDRAWENTVEGAGVLIIVLSVIGGFIWLIRMAVDYRRWGRLAKVQAEAHTKLLDRFTGNEELLAYVQSPAGARFLQSAPISLDGSPRAMGSPVSRILWSTQAGVVLTAAGLGMNYVSRHIDPNRAEPIFMFSVLLLSIGLGFVASAAMSYLLSKRLGIIGPSGAVEE